MNDIDRSVRRLQESVFQLRRQIDQLETTFNSHFEHIDAKLASLTENREREPD